MAHVSQSMGWVQYYPHCNLERERESETVPTPHQSFIPHTHALLLRLHSTSNTLSSSTRHHILDSPSHYFTHRHSHPLLLSTLHPPNSLYVYASPLLTSLLICFFRGQFFLIRRLFYTIFLIVAIIFLLHRMET